MTPQQALAWAHAERGRQALYALRTALRGVADVVVIKGVYMAFCVSSVPWYRTMADLDCVLLGPEDQAVAALDGADFQAIGLAENAVIFRAPNGIVVDLHTSLLAPGLGRFTREELGRRAILDRRLDALVPDPVDALLLGLAKYVTDRLGRDSNALASDLALVRDVHQPPASLLARRAAFHCLCTTVVAALSALCRADSAWQPYLAAMAPTQTQRVAAAVFGWVVSEAPASAGRQMARFLSDHPTDYLPVLGLRGVTALRKRLWDQGDR